MAILRISAYVKVPVEISPRSIYLKGQATKAVRKTVRIKGDRGRHLELKPLHFDLHERLTYKIEDISEGYSFRIHFKTVVGKHGKFVGALRLKTNYDDKPLIRIPIRLDIQRSES